MSGSGGSCGVALSGTGVRAGGRGEVRGNSKPGHLLNLKTEDDACARHVPHGRVRDGELDERGEDEESAGGWNFDHLFVFLVYGKVWQSGRWRGKPGTCLGWSKGKTDSESQSDKRCERDFLVPLPTVRSRERFYAKFAELSMTNTT